MGKYFSQRVYKNQTTLLEDGSRVLKKGVDKLTYEPVFKEGTNNIIIGFKDNTPSGQGLTYYGLNKNTPDGAASWSQHKDYNNVAKFIDITERVKEEPSKILQKILDDKGITKLMGDKSVLTLNDTDLSSIIICKSDAETPLRLDGNAHLLDLKH